VVYSRHADDGLPAFPFHFHIRFASGADVVGVVISARTEAAGEAAVRAILRALAAAHPPS
jgi:hypothetical protein